MVKLAYALVASGFLIMIAAGSIVSPLGFNFTTDGWKWTSIVLGLIGGVVGGSGCILAHIFDRESKND